MIIWNKEITNKLKNLSSENLIIEKLGNLLSQELINTYEIQKNSMIIEYDLESSRLVDNNVFFME